MNEEGFIFGRYEDLVTDEKAWKEQRAGKITASNLAKILHVDYSVSAQKLLRCMVTGIDPTEEEAARNPYLRKLLTYGREHEADARRDFFALMYRAFGGDLSVFSRTVGKLFPSGESHNDVLTWIKPSFFETARLRFGGTPDLILDFCRDGKHYPVFLCEFKCHMHPAEDTAHRIETAVEIPDKYVIQVQAYMLLIHRILYEDAAADEGCKDLYETLPLQCYFMSWTRLNGWKVYVMKACPALFDDIEEVSAQFYADIQEAKAKPDDVEVYTKMWRAKKRQYESVQKKINKYLLSLPPAITSEDFSTPEELRKKLLLYV